MNDVAVILIIAHKDSLTGGEKKSLLQCFHILNKYTIKLICPEGLDVSVYKEIIPGVQIEFIDPKWQSDYQMFNLLKIDLLLYEKFKRYRYILFYELDAWVFRDELAYWCSMGYDFIGAPWFEGWHLAGKSTTITGVGNGGFSLRNVQTSLRILKRITLIKRLRYLWYKLRLNNIWNFDKVIVRFRAPFKFNLMDEPVNKLFRPGTNEDIYWVRVAGGIFSDYKVAPVEDATRFSFELNPEFLFRMNNRQLPFGCHGWEKYDPEFWKPFIEEHFQKEISR